MNIFVRTAPFIDDDYYWYDVKEAKSIGYSIGDYYYDLIDAIDSSQESLLVATLNGMYILWASGIVTSRTDLHDRIITNSILIESNDREEIEDLFFLILGEDGNIFNKKFKKNLEKSIKCENSKFEVDKKSVLDILSLPVQLKKNRPVLEGALHANFSPQNLLELKQYVSSYSLPPVVIEDDLQIVYCITGNQDIQQIPIYPNGSRVLANIPKERPSWVSIIDGVEKGSIRNMKDGNVDWNSSSDTSRYSRSEKQSIGSDENPKTYKVNFKLLRKMIEIKVSINDLRNSKKENI